MMNWKPNWSETRQHFLDWWDRKGLILGMWGCGFPQPTPVHAAADYPAPTTDFEKFHTDPAYLTQRWHARMAHSLFPADTLPIVRPSAGPVELAAYLGAEVTFQEATIWYNHPPTFGDIKLDPDNQWYRRMFDTLHRLTAIANGHYAIGLPGIAPGLDVLAELYGTQELMMDMIERPDWVLARVEETDNIYFDVYDRFSELIRLPDDSIVYFPFMLWSPGRVSIMQCDAAAMISEDMFRQIVVPGLHRCCGWLDHSLFHVDGPGMIKHVDALCEIESLDAIQFTPGPTVPRGGDAHWHPMYKRILAAGKCVQAVWMSPPDVVPLLDAIGPKGVYLMVECDTADEMETLAETVQQYR
jgi:hypothetical protein